MNMMRLYSRLIIALASLSMTAVFFLPVWFIFLMAPQYPEGLEMNIWLTKITGQVDIINGLNHYIGMKSINQEMFPEFGYMKYILAGFIAYSLLVAIIGSRKLLFSLLVLTLIMAGAALYDFYKWGYDYGHNLDPKAAIKVPGLTYQPPLIGHKQLLNFDAYSYPDIGGWVITVAGSLFFVVYFLEWRHNRKASKTKASYNAKTTTVALVSVVFLLSACNTDSEPFAYGKDLCDDCQMTIMEPHFGAEIITKKGKIFKFDDVHCIANYIKKDKVKQEDIKQIIFIDYNKGEGFVDGSTAHFVVSPQLKSPMNSNAAAFATKEEAEKKAAETSGTIKTWNTLLHEAHTGNNTHQPTQVLTAGTKPVGAQESLTSLRSAVESALPGDTIFLKKGVYKEGNIIINKSISLIGEEGAVLDGEDKHEILTVSGENILIKGITFKNSGYSSMNDYASLKIVDAKNIMVENNTFIKAYFAIHIANVTSSTIHNNSISGLTKTEQTSGNGIHLWKCDDIQVKNNDIKGHRDGIYFEFVTNSVIENNNSHNNIRYGLHFMFSNHNKYTENTFRDNGAGVAVMYSHHVLMNGNYFEHNWGASAYGILLKEINDAQIYNNSFDGNTVGILMESTNRINVVNNNFESNGWALRIQASCSDNTITRNNFTANTFDVATNGSLSLNIFLNNYWDKYEGYDLNRNGVGDIAYHPVSMYSMIIEQNPNAVILMRSFMVTLLDKAEKAIPSLTPVDMVDEKPAMKMIKR